MVSKPEQALPGDSLGTPSGRTLQPGRRSGEQLGTAWGILVTFALSELVRCPYPGVDKICSPQRGVSVSESLPGSVGIANDLLNRAMTPELNSRAVLGQPENSAVEFGRWGAKKGWRWVMSRLSRRVL